MTALTDPYLAVRVNGRWSRPFECVVCEPSTVIVNDIVPGPDAAIVFDPRNTDPQDHQVAFEIDRFDPYEEAFPCLIKLGDPIFLDYDPTPQLRAKLHETGNAPAVNRDTND